MTHFTDQIHYKIWAVVIDRRGNDQRYEKEQAMHNSNKNDMTRRQNFQKA